MTRRRLLPSVIQIISIVVLPWVLSGPTPAFAQADTGSILGTIKDESGAVIPGAKVTVTNEGTNASFTVNTGPDGSYSVSPVRIGTYSVSAEAPGFQKIAQSHLTVNIQQQLVLDFTLKPGVVTQTVEVTAAPPMLQREEASVGEVVGRREVNDLPLNGRNFTFLAQLTAGVNQPQPETRGLSASGSFSANGSRPAQNNYILDGIDNNSDTVDFLNGTAFVVLPPVDAIQEFKVQTTDYSAQIGRAGGAVMNATIRSGTSGLHGDVWEFFRNDRLDAADFFENAGNSKKGEFRQNQFGFAVGGPITIPGYFNTSKNKVFFFGDYEALRRRQGTVSTATVPTMAERASGFTDFSDLIKGQTGGAPIKDLLGRSFPLGTVFDPATTRSVTAGQVDPSTGSTATASGFVRDPFAGNILRAARLDPNALKLLGLFPSPTSGSLFNNFVSSPTLKEDRNAFDVRTDFNISVQDQVFARFSLVDDPQFKPGPFAGIADGGGFNQGNQTALAQQGAVAWTHVFGPSFVNVARAGLTYLHTTRVQPSGNTLGLPGQFGISGIPQVAENGGLPQINIGGLQQLGGFGFLPSDEVSSTVQFTDDLTKTFGKHTFKMGLEFQHIKFSTLQPPWPRGDFDFDGRYTSQPGNNVGNTGRAQFLLKPISATVPKGIDNVGGADDFIGSNIALVDDGRNYWGAYFEDGWKVTPKLTLNLGVRWDFFAQVGENHSRQANFLPGPPGAGATYLIPLESKNAPNAPLSPSFISLLAKDGIALDFTKNFSPGLGTSQNGNFAPRIGFAYQINPKLVMRGSFGIFYGGFENRGFSPNIGENFPFQFNFNFSDSTSGVNPVSLKNTDGSVCTRAVVVTTGFSCIQLNPALVNASGLDLRGIQFNAITPYTQGINFTLEYQVDPNDTVSAAYVGSLARHLEVFPGSNEASIIVPPGVDRTPFLPYPDFGFANSFAAQEANSYYHSLQLKWNRRYAAGLNMLATYTYAKTRTDEHDLLNDVVGSFRGPYLPGFGIQADYARADFDVTNALHFSGGYELPWGRGKPFLGTVSRKMDWLVGGWSANWILTIQNGQPFTIPCDIATTNGGSASSFNGIQGACFALLVPGQNLYGPNAPDHFLNAKAFHNPPVATQAGQTNLAPLGGKPQQVAGPGFGRLDLSIFKNFQINERFRLELRSEFFNIANHPNFLPPGLNGATGIAAAPGSADFNNPNFGKITSTRDAPNDPRQIQFSLKVYF